MHGARDHRVGTGRALRGALALLLLPAATLALSPAQYGCRLSPIALARPSSDGEPAARRWPEPLDRVISVEADDISLHEALARVADASRVKLSYSPDLLPLERRICLPAGQAALGDVLMLLLDGAGVAPVVVASDQVVLAPARAAVGADATPLIARGAAQLARVVVTGSGSGTVQRASPFAISVIDGRALAPTSALSLSSILDGVVPGVWLWTQSPVSVAARYGGTRGASSFGVSTPKVYVDGIEVANPLMVTQLDPSSIERIEVIRGPQGAALYGSDAISGVVQIVTRHDGADPDAPASELRVSAGSASSTFATGGTLAQQYGLGIRHGAAARSASASVSLATLGAYAPGAEAQQLMASGALRQVGSRLITTATARLEATNADVPASPVLRLQFPNAAKLADSSPQRARQYTLGGSATFQANEEWTHAATIGVDGYRLSGLSGNALPLPSATDSALRAARGGADRVSLRLSSTRRLGAPETDGVLLTLGAEQSTAREETTGMGAQLASRTNDSGSVRPPTDASGIGTTWWHSTGLLAQAQTAWRGSLFLTGGARLEHLSGPATPPQFALLPLLGAAWVLEPGPVTLKLRGSFGRGIRPARTVARGATWMGGRGGQALASLAPEEQSGIEAGVDAIWGDRLTVALTRFDQHASGLVQPVAVLDYGGGSRPPAPGARARVLYQLQNVGAIDNRGWEMQARTAFGPLALASTFTLVSSRVSRLATGYLGDLAVGDRMLEVPARTAGLSAAWTASRWSAVGSLARAFDWVNYDKVALATTIAADATGERIPVGTALRAYWRSYEGNAHASLRLSYAMLPRSWISVSGDNLLNHQVGEPDDITVVPGRTLGLGLRTAF